MQAFNVRVIYKLQMFSFTNVHMKRQTCCRPMSSSVPLLIPITKSFLSIALHEPLA